MKKSQLKDIDPGARMIRRSIRENLKVIFFCMTALPFLVFAFVYFRIGAFNTALAGFLIALALILMLGGFIIFRKMADHIEKLSSTMVEAEDGKLDKIRDSGETRELFLIADTFNRTLSKLQEATRDLGLKATQASTLNEIREILSRTIRMEEVAGILLEKALSAVNAQAGYLAVEHDKSRKLIVVASMGTPPEMVREIDLDGTLAGLALSRRSPVLIEDVEQEEQLKGLNIPDVGVPRLLYLSVEGRDKPMGVLALGRERENACFKEEDLQFLQALIQQAAYNFENARLYQNLEQSKKKLEIALVSQKKARAQLLVSARMAAFGEISVNIANELNNPLTSILGYADLILGSSMEEKDTRENLETIRSQAIRAAEITRGLLDLAATGPEKKVFMDLNSLVKRTVSLVQSRLEAGGIRVDFKLAESLPPSLVDLSQMGQVCFNLASNAANAMMGKYSLQARFNETDSETGGKERLLTIETGEKNVGVYIAFKDTGCGILSDDLARIFEPFYSTRNKVSQVGLGLWMSERIVNAHGGNIQVKSVPGKGSLFVVTLPAGGKGV